VYKGQGSGGGSAGSTGSATSVGSLCRQRPGERCPSPGTCFVRSSYSLQSCSVFLFQTHGVPQCASEYYQLYDRSWGLSGQFNTGLSKFSTSTHLNRWDGLLLRFLPSTACWQTGGVHIRILSSCGQSRANSCTLLFILGFLNRHFLQVGNENPHRSTACDAEPIFLKKLFVTGAMLTKEKSLTDDNPVNIATACTRK
jgi:hypothetical protein